MQQQVERSAAKLEGLLHAVATGSKRSSLPGKHKSRKRLLASRAQCIC